MDGRYFVRTGAVCSDRAAAKAIIRFSILACQRDAYGGLAVFDPIG